MMAPPQALVDAAQGWAHLYSKTKAVSMAVTYIHLAGILLGGGAAVAADRDTLRAASDPEPVRAYHLTFLATVHNVAIGGLALIVVSGLLMFFADLETFWGSRIYWLKMSLFVLLLLNGALMKRAEGLVATNPDAAWKNLKTTSLTSLILWFTILLAGVILMSA